MTQPSQSSGHDIAYQAGYVAGLVDRVAVDGHTRRQQVDPAHQATPHG